MGSGLAQYTDLVNYITMRKGTIYTGTGTITRIVSTTPQMAIMNIGTDNFEKLVMLENSSKTTWTIGTKYRIFTAEPTACMTPCRA